MSRPTREAGRYLLRYDGALWGLVLERLLADEIVQGRARLLKFVSAPRR